MKLRSFVFAVSAVLAAIVSSTAGAATFQYNLSNHPYGNAADPLYGMRFDELFDVTEWNDKFTFDFNETEGTGMSLVYDEGSSSAYTDDTIRIFGRVYGGLDTGSSYGNPDFAGFWDVDFTYRNNISSAVNAARVDEEHWNNTGSLTPLFAVGGDQQTMGTAINLLDEDGGHGYSFKFNDTDDHRMGDQAADGTFVGWGWLGLDNGAGEQGGLERNPDNRHGDWLFTGEQVDPVPEPGSIALMSIGLVSAAALRRRKKQAETEQEH